WVSSRYYLPSGVLPAWVSELNAALAKRRGEKIEWKAPVEGTGYSSNDELPVAEGFAPKFAPAFPHQGELGDRASLGMPPGAEITEQAAEKAFDTLKLGRGKGIDLLAVSFSGHDYLGHALGPNSRELE